MLETYRDGIEVGPNSSLMIMMAMPLTDVEIANLNEISRVYNNTSKIPKSLSIELVKTTALAQDLWSNAKKTVQKLTKNMQKKSKQGP